MWKSMFYFIDYVVIISEPCVTVSELITEATSVLQKRLRSQNNNLRPENSGNAFDNTFDLGHCIVFYYSSTFIIM